MKEEKGRKEKSYLTRARKHSLTPIPSHTSVPPLDICILDFLDVEYSDVFPG
jgi:hypothetical protein